MEEGEKPVLSFEGKLRTGRERASYQQWDLPYIPTPSNIKLVPSPSPRVPLAPSGPCLHPTPIPTPLLSHGLSLSHQLPRHEALPSACLQLVSFLCGFPWPAFQCTCVCVNVCASTDV